MVGRMSRTSISYRASITALPMAGLAPARWNLPQTSAISGSPAALGANASSTAPSPHRFEMSVSAN
jgi:hypothetical protein